MADNKRTREVTVKWVSDKESLRDLLNDVETVKQAYASLGSLRPASASQHGGTRLPGSLPTSIPRDTTGGQPGGGSGFQAPLMASSGNPNGSQEAMAPASGQQAGMMSVTVANMTVTAQTVNLTATNVMGGGGGTGGSSTGQGGDSGGGGGGVNRLSSYLQNFRLGTLLGGDGGPGSAMAGNLLNQLLPLAPAALPVALLSAIAQATQAGELAQSGMGLRQYQVGTGAAYGSRPEAALGSKLAIEQERANMAGYQSFQNNFLVNALTFGQSGVDVQLTDLEREKQKQLAESAEVQAGRKQGFKFRRDGRLLSSIYSASDEPAERGHYETRDWMHQESFFGNEPVWVKDDNTAAVAADQLNKYRVGRLADSQHGFAAFAGDPSFQRFLAKYGGSATSFDETVMPVMGGISGVDPRQYPQMLALMRSGNFQGQLGMTEGAAYTSALGGDLAGVMRQQASLNLLDPKGGKLEAVLDALQQVVLLQKDMAMQSIRGGTLQAQSLGMAAGVQASLYSGAVPTTSMGAGIRANTVATVSTLNQQISDKRGMRKVAEMTGDPQKVAEIDMEIAQLQAQVAQSGVSVTESLRDDYSRVYGYRSSLVQLGQAGVSQAVSREQRLGGYSSQARAERGGLGFIREQISIEEQKLSLVDQNAMDQTEANQVRARIVQLATDLANSVFDIAKREFGGAMSLSSTRQGTALARMGRELSVGGSLEAQGSLSGSTAQSRYQIERLELRQRELESQGVSGDNPEYAENERQIEQAKGGLVSSYSQPYTPSYGVRMSQRVLSRYQRTFQSTFAFSGDVRRSYEEQMDLAARQIGEIEKVRKARTADAMKIQDPKLRAQALAKIEEQFQTDVENPYNQALGAQSYLEAGWQERIASSVYGNTSQSAAVMTQFTRRESAQFAGVYNRVFGGNFDQMTQARKSGALQYFGNFASQSPEGLANLGMGASEAPPIVVVGQAEVTVTMKDPQGHVADKQRVLVPMTQQSGLDPSARPKTSFKGG